MANHSPRSYLACYDITEPRRLAAVHRRLKRDGIALQYSVFQCTLTSKQLRRLIGDLRLLIDSSSDDIRIYGMREGADLRMLGPATTPDLLL